MKLNLWIKNIVALTCVPAGTISMVPMLSTISPTASEGTPIDVSWLDIDANGVVQGFKKDVTLDQIRNGRYDTLLIPESINGTTVTEIADYAFAYVFDNKSTYVTKLVLPSTITRIGRGAFLYCYGFVGKLPLNELTELTYIGQDAFNYCPLLSGDLVLPEGIEYIGEGAFKGCQGFTSITIPESLKTLGDYAFEDCTHVSNVYISNTSEEQYLPEWSLRKSYAFTDLGSMASSSEEETEKTIWIGDATIPAAEWTDSFREKLNLPNEFEIHVRKEIDKSLLKLENDDTELCGFNKSFDVSQYNALTIPDSVTKITEGAFKNKITSKLHIVFNKGLQEIQASAFEGCGGITGQIVLPTSVTTIGARAFKGCTGITGTFTIPLYLPDKKIPEEMLQGCTKLTKVVFLEEAADIEPAAFKGCSQLSVLDFSNIENFLMPDWKNEKEQFSGLPTYGTVFLPTTAREEVEENYINKLMDCDLSTANLWCRTCAPKSASKEFPHHPEQPIEGQSYCFSGDELVKMREYLSTDRKLNVEDYQVVSIPSNTAKIRDNAFNQKFVMTSAGKPYLKGNWVLKFNHSVKEIGENAFANNNGIFGSIELQYPLNTIKTNAFGQCENIERVVIPNTVNTIGNAIFASCKKLKVIDLTSFDSMPTGWGSKPFGLPEDKDSVKGVFLVKTGKKTQWTALLSSELSSSKWTVKEV